MTSSPRATKRVAKRWSSEQIRAARQTPLYPVLLRLGHRLEHVGEGNFLVADSPLGLVVKANYWTSTHTGRSGNAIDFLVHVAHMRFEEAMTLLLSYNQSDHSQKTELS